MLDNEILQVGYILNPLSFQWVHSCVRLWAMRVMLWGSALDAWRDDMWPYSILRFN
ncbi:uncharacterized protein EI90DRAFT_3085479 [Cantharellus anzutake]|uniref:uncharacterized protein n=1 Tax=Cantharellus anzutake TaxID=1750568 RepID=UPI001906B213|nr:uncharacterized protein EI90DRAFT_3085479 [Cantharellus anzutake]KAF8317264.1 hypothetical protein EI90DRAFT_3085479 [Cantharellus anzutake]